MIDGLKLGIHGRTRERLRGNELIQWRPNGTTKDERPKCRGTWQGFTFAGGERECWEFRGSFHKYHEGGANCGDFTFSRFEHAMNEVCDLLRLHPADVTVHNVETGVNLCPSLSTRKVLERIIMHKGARPTQMKEAAPGHGITIDHTTFIFKIYDKAEQNDMDSELLRFEVADSKMAAIQAAIWPNPKDRRTVTLADLLDPRVWRALQILALRRFDELLILEPDINTDGLSKKDRDLLSNATRPDYWQGLKRSTRSDQRRRLERINAERGTSNLKAELRQQIVDKFTAAIDVDARTFCPRVEPVDTAPAEVANRTTCPLVLKGQNVREEGTGEEVRRCPVCGRDITHQDARSQTCSERLYGKEGKRCRNALSNRFLSLRRMDVRSAPLFDQRPFIRPLGPLQEPNASAR